MNGRIDINDKICAILAHGRSLEELEKRIEEFKDFDIVWCGMNYFSPSEEILKKIGKEFVVVYDSSRVENAIEYELKARLPRLIEYLSRTTNNVYITVRTGKDNISELRDKIGSNFNKRFKDKIIYAEDIGFDITKFGVSLSLYITCLLKLGAKKIILFGADGGKTDVNNLKTYYKSELVLSDYNIANNMRHNYNMTTDTSNINTTFNIATQQIFGYIPEIINCSPISIYTSFKKMNYDEVIDLLKGLMQDRKIAHISKTRSSAAPIAGGG